MTQVNSPFVLSKIRPINQYTDAQNNYFFQLERILQQLYQRTGSSTDSVDENEGLLTSTAYVMSIANQGLHEIEELSAYNYARHQADLDRLKDNVDEMAALSTARCINDSLLDRLSEVEARQNYIAGTLDKINEQLKELEAVSYGYNS